MMTKKKHKRAIGHRYDWGEFLQFMKDNPELMKFAGQMAGGMMSQNQQQQPTQPNYGVTGQQQTWSGNATPLTNEVANIANMIGGLSDKGNVPVEQAMGLPGSYYSRGGRIFDGGGSFFGANMGNSASGYVNAGFDGVTNILGQAKGVNVDSYVNKAKNFGNQVIKANDNQQLLNAWQNRARLNNVDKYDITGGNLGSEILGRVNQNIGAAGKGFMTTGNWIGAVIGGVTDLIGQGLNIFNTNKNVKRLNNAIDVANVRQDRALNDASRNVQQDTVNNLLANYSAYGGPLYNTPYFGYGVTAYDLAKDNSYTEQLKAQSKNSTSFTPIFNSSPYGFADGGGIYIKPSKRGTFTAAAKSRGMGVQEFASKVLANKEDYSPAMVKKANFARNASRWHANGGLLLSDEFTNGVTLIDQGGTHENNPHEGVQMGIAPDGKPNLVEEGEAIFNNYVFSNRLRVPKEVRNKYKLRGPKDMTFAEAFREAQKESEERPNDPISKKGLEDIAMILARTQEAVRGYEKSHKKAKGGHMYDGITNPYGYQEVVEEPVDEPEVDAAINAFWKNKLGDQWNNPNARKKYMRDDQGGDTNLSRTLGYLRFTEPFANARAVLSDALGLTNNPYVYDFIPAFQGVGYNPLSNYIPVTHFDTRYAANQQAQQAAATRNAIMQSGAPSKWTNLLAADYNAQIANGELLRQGALQDYNMMLQREQFNRGTNQANSQMGIQTSLANQDARLKYAQAALQQAKMNVDETNATMGAKAANESALAESIANIGRERDAYDWRDMLIRASAFGTLSEKPSSWTDAEWREYQKAIRESSKSTSAAKGGKIRKRKKGLTY